MCGQRIMMTTDLQQEWLQTCSRARCLGLSLTRVRPNQDKSFHIVDTRPEFGVSNEGGDGRTVYRRLVPVFAFAEVIFL